MTKAKIKYVLRRLTSIQEMIEKGITKQRFYIGKKTEWIEIDADVVIILESIKDIFENTREDWVKQIIRRVRKGKKDIYIMMHSPVGRGKYYVTKERLLNKIYDCCIFKGAVSYEEILKEKLG